MKRGTGSRWLVSAGLCAAILGWRYEGPAPTRQANAGDSISQGYDAAPSGVTPGDQPEYSWVQGTSADVKSLFMRYAELHPGFAQKPESVSGAEMVGGGDSFPAQAARICAQDPKPDRVFALLGGNDVCNRAKATNPVANLYSVETFTGALEAGLEQLAACLPTGTVVQVVSMPRVDFLYKAGKARGFWCSVVWSTAKICRIVTAESSDDRRAAIGRRVDDYNTALAQSVDTFDRNLNGKNERRVRFTTDWVGSIDLGKPKTSIGTVVFGPNDISSLDCFHPNVAGQKMIACSAWATHPEGSGTVAECVP